MPDLDQLLFGEPVIDMSLVADALQEGYDEEWQVDLIKRYLITDDQWALLAAHDHASISDLLNGRIENDDISSGIFNAWNDRLGRKVFGF